MLWWDMASWKAEMSWPWMSPESLSGGFGSWLKAIKKCHFHDKSHNKPITEKSPMAAHTPQLSDAWRWFLQAWGL